MASGGPSQLGGCRFFQLGYVVHDIDQAVAQFTGMFAATLKDLTRDMRDQHGEISLIQNLSHLMLGGVEIELIEPREGWPSVYGDGNLQAEQSIRLHHLGFMAQDDGQWNTATAILIASGASTAMSLDLPMVRLSYFDTRASLGHYTELVQRRQAIELAI